MVSTVLCAEATQLFSSQKSNWARQNISGWAQTKCSTPLRFSFERTSVGCSRYMPIPLAAPAAPLLSNATKQPGKRQAWIQQASKKALPIVSTSSPLISKVLHCCQITQDGSTSLH